MKTEQLIDCEGITLESAKPFAFSCCDCGLTHHMSIVSEDGRPVGFAVKRITESAPPAGEATDMLYCAMVELRYGSGDVTLTREMAAALLNQLEGTATQAQPSPHPAVVGSGGVPGASVAEPVADEFTQGVNAAAALEWIAAQSRAQDAATVAVGEPSKYGSPEMQSLILAKLATPPAQGDGREAKSYSGSVHLGSGASGGVQGAGLVAVQMQHPGPHDVRINVTAQDVDEIVNGAPAGGNVHGRAVVSAYSIQISDKPFAEEITVQRMRQIDGTPLWSVKLGGNCLNKSGEWEWEPMPSSRDDEFLARCRFESPEAAIDAAILSTASPAGEGKGEGKL